MIVRNEADNLHQCLSSLRGLVDEINIVDTGSTDDSQDIARSFAANIRSSPWRNDFSYHRNESLAMAAGKWQFVVDADEVLAESDPEETRRNLALRRLPPVALVRERLIYPNKSTLSFLSPRFLRRSARIRYQYPVHEQLVGREDCDAVLSNVVLEHRGYVDEGQLRKKEQRNLELALPFRDQPHGAHCVARAALSLKLWHQVIDACSALLSMECAPIMKIEGCAMAAAAALQVRDFESVSRFASEGSRLCSTVLDAAFLNMLASTAVYLEALDADGAEAPCDLLRPWIFPHNSRAVRRALEILVGRHALCAPSRGGTSANDSVQTTPRRGRHE